MHVVAMGEKGWCARVQAGVGQLVVASRADG